MPVYDIYSKRVKSKPTGKPQYIYSLPTTFRIQVIHIWKSAIGEIMTDEDWLGANIEHTNRIRFWQKIHDILCREKGVFRLYTAPGPINLVCEKYLLQADVEEALDIIEISFRRLPSHKRPEEPFDRHLQSADDAIKELNHRFQENGIGYQFYEGKIFRVDSTELHHEAVVPALNLLKKHSFAGPREELLMALEHHRRGNEKDAIAAACRAFESTMKAICELRRWTPPKNATAFVLIAFLIKKGLLPAALETQYGSLQSLLSSGLPTLGNRTSRHGQGRTVRNVPPYFAAYAIHLAATNVLFLMEAYQSKTSR